MAFRGTRAISIAVFSLTTVFVYPANAGETPQCEILLDPLPEGCPAPAAAMRSIAHGLPADAPAKVHGTVKRGPRGFAMLLMIDRAGERVLEAPTCQAVLDAAGVVVAMSGSHEATAEPAAIPAPALVPVDVEPPPARDVPRPPVAPVRSAAVIRAFGTGDAGTLPALTFGAGLALGVARGPLRAEIAGAIYAGKDGFVDPDRGAHFSLAEVRGRGCLRVVASVPLEPCAGIAVLRVGATGFGARSVADTAALVWGPEASLEGALDVSDGWGLRLGAGAMFPTTRPGFEITGRGTVHELAPVAFRASIGPEVRF